jgi:hypothetical protein
MKLKGGIGALRPKFLRCPGASVTVRYEKRIVHFLHDEALLTQNPLHPSRPQMDSWLDDVPKGTLRWHVTTRPATSKIRKAIVRSALQSKWYKLMCRALQQRGYTPDGRRAQSGEVGLVGTLEVIVPHGSNFGESESRHLQRCVEIVAAVEREHQSQQLRRR